MKKLFLALIAVAAMAMAFTKVQNEGLAKVKTIEGKEVYVLSDPLRNYTVVETYTTALVTAVAGRQTIENQMKDIIWRGNKNKIDFDALLTDDGKKVTLIKFKE